MRSVFAITMNAFPYNNLKTGTLVYRVRTQINFKDVMIPS
jgi:hypothetical protein